MGKTPVFNCHFVGEWLTGKAELKSYAELAKHIMESHTDVHCNNTEFVCTDKMFQVSIEDRDYDELTAVQHGFFMSCEESFSNVVTLYFHFVGKLSSFSSPPRQQIFTSIFLFILFGCYMAGRGGGVGRKIAAKKALPRPLFFYKFWLGTFPFSTPNLQHFYKRFTKKTIVRIVRLF